MKVAQRIYLSPTPDSSDLAVCDFYLLSKLKRSLRKNRFEPIEEIKCKSFYFKKNYSKQRNSFYKTYM